MTDANRDLIRAKRFLPAILAASVSLLALAALSAGPTIDWLRGRSPQATPQTVPAAGTELASEEQCFGDEDAPWLIRHASTSGSAFETAQAAQGDVQGECAGDACFVTDDFGLASFEPSAGGVPQDEGGGEIAGDQGDPGGAPPASPSNEPIDVASLDTFTADNGFGPSPGGSGGAVGGSGGAGSGGTGPGGGGTTAGDGSGSGGGQMDYVLLPGTSLVGTSGAGGDGGGGGGGTGGTGGTTPDGQQSGGGSGGSGGSGGGSGTGGVPVIFGAVPSASDGTGNGSGDPDGSTPITGIAPAGGPIDVSAPASAPLLAAALAALALRRRVGRG